MCYFMTLNWLAYKNLNCYKIILFTFTQTDQWWGDIFLLPMKGDITTDGQLNKRNFIRIEISWSLQSVLQKHQTISQLYSLVQ